MYTTYYYYVTVSDGIASQTSSKPSVRTYCSGQTNTCNTSICPGFSQCATCTGTGVREEECGGSLDKSTGSLHTRNLP